MEVQTPELDVSTIDQIESERDVMSVSVVIPAYNEAGAIRAQIESVRTELNRAGIEHEIIVVDDGSADATAAEAESTGVRVIRNLRNRGYGASLKAGIRAATYETIAITDADGTYPSESLPDLIDRARDFDMVVGSRTGMDVHIPLARRPAKWFLRVLAGYVTRHRIPDLNSGMRIMKKSLVRKFEYILPSGFSFTTTITLALLSNDYLVHYQPINYNRRIGQSKIRPVDAYHFTILILRTIVFFNPLRVFMPAGAVLFLLGFGKLVYDLFKDNISETAIFGLLAAIIIWALGLLSDQMARLGVAIRSTD